MSQHRIKLSDRRQSATYKITTEKHSFFITVGYDPIDHITPKEVFYDTGFKEGSDMQFIINDICIMISMCLQCGNCPDDIGNSLSKFEDRGIDIHGSIVGHIVDVLKKPSLFKSLI